MLVLVLSPVVLERDPCAVLYALLVASPVAQERERHKLSSYDQHFVLAVPEAGQEREQQHFVTDADPALHL